MYVAGYIYRKYNIQVSLREGDVLGLVLSFDPHFACLFGKGLLSMSLTW